MSLFGNFFNAFGGNGIKNISTVELKELLQEKKGKLFIDVRTKQEFKGNHIRGFENIPLDKLENKIPSLPKDKTIIVICQSGGRSSSACGMLKKAGFENVTNVSGGMSQWR